MGTPSSSPGPVGAAAAAAASSAAAPPRSALSKEQIAQSASKIGRIFAKSVPNIPKLQEEYVRSGIGYIADSHSQNLQLLQTLELDRPCPTLGLLNYNNFTRVVTRTVDFAGTLVEGTKSLRAEGLSAITGPQSNTALEKAATALSKTSNLAQGATLTAYQICSTVGTGAKIAKNVGAGFSDSTKAAFGRVSTAGGVLLTIFSGLRAISAIGNFFKVRQQKKLFSDSILLSDKMKALEGLLEVKDHEVFKYLEKHKTSSATISNFLTAYAESKFVKHQADILKKLGCQQLPNPDEILEGISSGEYRAFLKEKFKIEAALDNECRAPEAFFGLILLKSELSVKKQEAFLDTFAESTLHRDKIKTLMKSAIKAHQIGTSLYGAQKLDVTLMNLFESVKVGMNRKQMKNIVVILSAVLTIACCVTMIMCPPAIIPVVILAVASNFLEFAISQREFRNMALELDAAQSSTRAAGTSSLLARLTQSLKTMPWKNKLSMAVSMASVVLFLCCLFTPLGAGIAATSLIASGIVISLFFLYNLATVHKATRDLMIKKADMWDEYVNQKFGFFGSAIEESRAEKSQQDTMKHIRLRDKLEKMTPELLQNVVQAFQITDAEIETRKTFILPSFMVEEEATKEAKIQLILEKSRADGLTQTLARYRQAKLNYMQAHFPTITRAPVLP